MPRYFNLGIGLVGLIAVACGLFAARSLSNGNGGARNSAAPVPVTAAEVVRQDVPIVLEGLGTVRALYTATIRTQVTGTLEEVDFSKGVKVKRGQVLAQIDPRTFQAHLDQAMATRDRDQAHLANAKANLGRNEPLLKRGFATGQQVDTQTAQVTQLQNMVKADEAAIDAADGAELHHDHRAV